MPFRLLSTLVVSAFLCFSIVGQEIPPDQRPRVLLDEGTPFPGFQSPSVDTGLAVRALDLNVNAGFASAQPNSERILPNAPVAKPVSVCPQGIGQPCALLGGKYYRPSSLSMHDPSWRKAMSHPHLIVGTSVLIAAFFEDYKTTRYCIDHGRGHEANPLLGDNPARELGVGLTATGLGIWGAGASKEHGDGKFAVIALYADTIVHALAAAHNAVACGGY